MLSAKDDSLEILQNKLYLGTKLEKIINEINDLN